MQSLTTSRFLRRVLFADAATCVAAGLLMTFGSSLLERFFELPAELSHYAGISLFPFAALLVYLAMRENLSPTAVWVVIALNVLWTADSLLLLVGSWVEPTGFGYAFVIFQACGVMIFAALEYFGLRKSAA